MRVRLLALLLIGLTLPVSSVNAQVQTFYFGGQLTGFHDPSSISPFNFGDRFDGSYSFDTSTIGTFPRGYDADYANALTAVSITIGSFLYSSSPASQSSIYIENAGLHPEITSDYYQVFGDALAGPTIGGEAFAPAWFLSIRDHSGEMLPDLSLPATISPVLEPGQSSFDIRVWDADRNIIYFAGGGLSYFSATPPITTPIPEPETYAMLLAGLALLGFEARRRRHRRHG
jgi:hypothetical protein